MQMHSSSITPLAACERTVHTAKAQAGKMGMQALGEPLLIEGTLKPELKEIDGHTCLVIQLPNHVDNKTVELSYVNAEDSHCDVHLDDMANGSKLAHIRVSGYFVNLTLHPKYKKQSRRYIVWLSQASSGGADLSPTHAHQPISLVDDIDADTGDTFHDAESGSDVVPELAADAAQQEQAAADVSAAGRLDVTKKKKTGKGGDGLEDAANADDREATMDQNTRQTQQGGQSSQEANGEAAPARPLTKGQKKNKKRKAKKARAVDGQASGDEDSGSDAEQGNSNAAAAAAAPAPKPITAAMIPAEADTISREEKATEKAKNAAAANNQAGTGEDSQEVEKPATTPAAPAAKPPTPSQQQQEQVSSPAVSPTDNALRDPFSAMQRDSDSGAGEDKPGSLLAPLSRLQSATLSTMTSGVSLMTPASGVSRRVTVNMDQDFSSEPDSTFELSKPGADKVPYDQLHGPFIKIGFGKNETKGEDKWVNLTGNKFEVPALGAETSFAAFAVFDGHGGKQSATEASKHLIEKVCKATTKVKSDLASPVALPGCTEKDAAVWAVQDTMIQRLPKALHAAFVEQDLELQRRYKTSGTTATLAMLVGWELLVANVGDSCAYLDTGAEVIQISGNHRVTENAEEQARVKAAGSGIAQSDVDGVIAGPLRVWPGGLAMTRSLGDKEAGPAVTGEPEIRQITIPANGARLIIASDGLWDAIQPKTIIHKVRNMVVGAAANMAKYTALEKKGLSDDITVIVVDFCVDPTDKLPPQVAATAAIAHHRNTPPIDVSHMWKPMEAPSVSWTERLNSRRDTALQRLKAKLQAEEEAKAKEAAARQAAAAAAKAAESDTYRELLSLKLDDDALDAAMKLGQSATGVQGAGSSDAQQLAAVTEAAAEEHGDEWTTVKDRSNNKASQAGPQGQGRGHRGEGRGGRGAGRGGRGGRGMPAQPADGTHVDGHTEAQGETAPTEPFAARGRGRGRGGRGFRRDHAAGEHLPEHGPEGEMKQHAGAAQPAPGQQEFMAQHADDESQLGKLKDVGIIPGPLPKDEFQGGRGRGRGRDYGDHGYEYRGRGGRGGRSGRYHSQQQPAEAAGAVADHAIGVSQDAGMVPPPPATDFGYSRGGRGRGRGHEGPGRGGRGGPGRSYSQRQAADPSQAEHQAGPEREHSSQAHTPAGPEGQAPRQHSAEAGQVPPPPATDFGYRAGRGRGGRRGGRGGPAQAEAGEHHSSQPGREAPERHYSGETHVAASRDHTAAAAGQAATGAAGREGGEEAGRHREGRRDRQRSTPHEQNAGAQHPPSQNGQHTQQQQQHGAPEKTAAVERSGAKQHVAEGAQPPRRQVSDAAGNGRAGTGAVKAAAEHEQPHSNGHAEGGRGRGRGGRGRGRGLGGAEPGRGAANPPSGLAFGDFGAGYGPGV